jgi:hypothetical protein
MRIMMAIFTALCLLVGPARAAIFEIPNGGALIYGDFAHAPAYGVPVAISYQATYFLSPYNPSDPSSFSEVSILISGPGGIRIQAYDCNQFDAHCGRSNINQNITSVFGSDGVGLLSVYGGITGGGPGASLKLFASLPTGFSLDPPIVASAVPEPSTWAMLLIGFAGVGYTAHRRRKVATLAA